MANTLLAVAGVALIWAVYTVVTGLRTNIARAKRSGLPYYVVPCNPIAIYSQLTYPIWSRLWKLLCPQKYWETVVDICSPGWQWTYQYAPFEKLGTDSFLLVSPSSCLMMTADPNVIHQITSKREAFPKPTEVYGLLGLFGENLVTLEGQAWRSHRKITSASFNEGNNALVFDVAVQEARGMLGKWLGGGGETGREGVERIKSSGGLEELEDDTMSLALHVISYVGFGLRLVWPGAKKGQGEKEDDGGRISKSVGGGGGRLPAGHNLTFRDAVAGTLENLVVLLIMPAVALDLLPLKKFKAASESKNNFSRYMDEMMRDKAEDIKRGDREEGMDLMGSLIASQQDPSSKMASLTDDEIKGNAFIMFLAGHETTANVLHFTMLELANNPAMQRRLQADIDRILGKDSDPSEDWDHDTHINAMMGSYLGACMNETLRAYPPVNEIPKKTHPTRDQTITVNARGTGEKESHVLPTDMYIGMNVVSAARNPGFWPGDDLNEWVPERWYRKKADNAAAAEEDDEEQNEVESYGGPTGPDTSAEMYRPVRGSYVPFSDGPRSCLGRRIAQVEVVTALAVVFQKYSLENVVDVSDEEIEKMEKGGEERREVYAKAVDHSRNMLRGMTSVITLKFHGKQRVPVRLVRRGEEKFVDWY